MELLFSNLQLLFDLGSRHRSSRLSLEARNLPGYLFNDVIETNNLRLRVLHPLRHGVDIVAET